MTAKLVLKALCKYIAGLVVAGALIFIPAGSLAFFNGWLFMGLLFVPMLIAGVVLMFKNPELLEKRLNAKEKQNDQGIVIKLSGLMFLAGFIVSGLGFRSASFVGNNCCVCSFYLSLRYVRRGFKRKYILKPHN
ncbi:MAG: hypothetical protein MJ196_10375 [Treponemataceae bacterium]|nr:hypothetical protein [Treponemataceae bacterium]